MRFLLRTVLGLSIGLVFLGCRTNESPEAQARDLKITAQVKTKLATEIGPDSIANISVNSTNGVVTLSGQVDSPQIKSKAEAVAERVPNVVRVVDTIQIATKPASSSGANWSRFAPTDT